MKKIIFFLLIIFSQQLYSQPAIQWQRCYGGSYDEFINSIYKTQDGGYILAGSTGSPNDGDVSGNHVTVGNWFDFWIVKIDFNGNIQWQKCLGGTMDEEAWPIVQTSDGGYVVSGWFGSLDGDINCFPFVNRDYWVVKIDGSGSVVWKRCYGGGVGGIATSMQTTTDQGFIITGHTASNDGQVTGNHGSEDFWVIKLDSTGNLQWQKALGGSGIERSWCIQQTPDGGYITVGQTASNDGDVTGHHSGYWDGWVVKLDAAGSMQWQKCLGGSGGTGFTSVQNTVDGGYIVAGSTSANDGDVSGNHSTLSDYWIVKLSAAGTVQWQKCLGGSSQEYAFAIRQTQDDGYIITGNAASIDGDVNGLNGDTDGWVVKLDSTGNIQWQKCLGGSGNEMAHNSSVEQGADNGFIITGDVDSNDGDVSGNHGALDFWVVKLAHDIGLEEQDIVSIANIFPNPVTDEFRINNSELIIERVEVCDVFGKSIFKQGLKVIDQQEITINVSAFVAGMYFVKLQTNKGTVAKKFLIAR